MRLAPHGTIFENPAHSIIAKTNAAKPTHAHRGARRRQLLGSRAMADTKTGRPVSASFVNAANSRHNRRTLSPLFVSQPISSPLPVDSSATPPLERSAALPGRFVPIGVKFAFVSVLVVGIATAVAFFQATHRE